MTPALSIRNLTHVYPPARSPRSRRGASVSDAKLKAGSGPSRALDQVSFDVSEGEVFGILGPNGSGKTSLFRIAATLMQPTDGRVEVFGADAATQSAAVRGMLGIVFQMPSLDAKLTAEENLRHQGHLYGLSGAVLQSRINEQLQAFRLHDRRDETIERFSGGMRRRIELAKSLLHQPPLLLLDEPATGLDVGARRDLWQQLKRLRDERGTTVVMTTHLMDEADRCDRLAILSEGHLVALDSPKTLKAKIGGDVVSIEPQDQSGIDAMCRELTERFGPWPKGGEPAVVHDRIYLEKPDGAVFVATVSAAIAGRAQSITVGRPTLEDVFLHLTGHRLYRDGKSD